MINIDLDNVNEEAVYRAFNVDGNEAEALNDSYLELFELIGRDAMLKLFKYFRGDKIDCPMRLYRPEFIADLAKQTTDRRERAKIARAGGYTEMKSGADLLAFSPKKAACIKALQALPAARAYLKISALKAVTADHPKEVCQKQPYMFWKNRSHC